MRWYDPPYISVAERRAKAAKEAAKMAKKGIRLSPVKINGRTIASTFWGKAWCKHLESFSDYENRLPRGRTYVRNGSVIDLQIEPAKITAQVMGSSLYKQTITIAPIVAARWKTIKNACSGQIDSLVELLQGRLSNGVMAVITHRDEGMFPLPKEIKMDCSCPDGAVLCKHLAAVLYGVGARLDRQPELLFTLRQADHAELITEAVSSQAIPAAGATDLDTASLADVFGIDIEDAPAQPQVAKSAPRPKAKTKSKANPAKAPKSRASKMTAKPRKAAKTAKEKKKITAPAPKARSKAKDRQKPFPRTSKRKKITPRITDPAAIQS